MKKTILLFALFFIVFNYAETAVDSTEIYIQQIEKSLKYKDGTIALPKGNAKIIVPTGFKFLDQEQTNYVLTDLWGNPKDNDVLGMLVPAEQGLLGDKSWAFIISYDNMGFVKDDDAKDIDYKELEEQLKKDAKDANKERIKQGYDPIEFVGWATPPYYDKKEKVLHWAKELKFGTNDSIENTLNYNLRILGRKGLFMINAVALKSQLKEVEAKIAPVLSSVKFNKGFAYSDYKPDVDTVAKWTIGGLIAGKVLAKVGAFALLIKFWKLIAIGFAGIVSFFRKKKQRD